MSTSVNIYVLSFNFFQHLYIFEFQVFSGCFPTIYENVRFCKVVIPFLYLPSILFYSGEVFKISLASFSLRLLFYGLQKLQILTASAPASSGFFTASSWLPLGFVLDFLSSSILFFSGFARASFSQFAHS